MTKSVDKLLTIVIFVPNLKLRIMKTTIEFKGSEIEVEFERVPMQRGDLETEHIPEHLEVDAYSIGGEDVTELLEVFDDEIYQELSKQILNR